MKAIFLIALLFVPSLCFGDIYKKYLPGGHVVYSDAPEDGFVLFKKAVPNKKIKAIKPAQKKRLAKKTAANKAILEKNRRAIV